MHAMILAAGRGERMRPLTDHCPKPLLQAGGKALIVWHIEKLRAAGLCDIVINHAHLGHMIEETLGDGRRYGVRIHYSPEREALETAGGIRAALPHLGSEAFVVISGDIHCDFDLSMLQAAGARLAPDGDLAHLVLVPNPPHHPEGDFELVDDRLADSGTNCHTFSGIAAYHRALFASLQSGVKARIAPILRDAMRAGRVSGSLHRGYWLDVGTSDRLAELDAHLRRHGAGA